MKVRYERGAFADLEEIFAYIAADDLAAAARLVTRIEAVAARLADVPYIGEATRKSPISSISNWQLFDRV